MNKVLITGAAGFIGSHLYQRLENSYQVKGLDNFNDYYDVNLKIERAKGKNIETVDLTDKEALNRLFQEFKPDIVVNLAAQAGVRYSIENPDAYGQSNLIGFLNILEACRHNNVKHLIYASSSSVYGENAKIPFSVEDDVSSPVSLYAATKKANELMAHSYSHLYKFPTTGLRFFTVYGPAGRPDMAYFLFTKAILEGRSIKVFNQGEMYRDFTYIDDIVSGIERIITKGPLSQDIPYRIYNIGNGAPVKLLDFIGEIESKLGIEGKKEYLPMQDGDVPRTWADTEALERDFGYKPTTSLSTGIDKFITWYRDFYKIQV